MQYLVTTTNGEPFTSKWFDVENNFNAEIGMVVYDLIDFCYTKDGKNWLPMEAKKHKYVK